MKKLSLFLFGFLATAFTAMASEITPATFTTPANTGANMTVGINASKFDQFEGGKIGAFIELDGVLTCVGSETISTGFFGLAIWGDDSSTPEADGLASGAKPTFAILHDGNVILIDEIPQFTGYVTNGNVVINDGALTGGSGCTDENACNSMDMYADVDYTDDGSCTYASTGYNCDGVCLNDSDDDDVCDEFEVAGCQDDSACNYNALATDSDGSCTYATPGYDCDGVCLNDCDGDGVCDEFEVLGCQDNAYDNFNPDATDSVDCDGNPGTCTGLLGCTDSLYAEYYAVFPTYDDILADNSAGYEVDNGTCSTEIIIGCTNPSAENYNADANVNITDEDHPDFCIAAPICFTTDPDFPCATVTSNNMSVLFPVNNAGLWNTDQSDIQAGDMIAAFYTTGTLENDFLGYSAISSIANAGDVVWTGDQVGLAVFGADNMINNGYAPDEELKWFVLSAGVVYEAAVTYATPSYDGTYQDGSYVAV